MEQNFGQHIKKENLDSVYADNNSVGFEYLKQIVDLCNESDVELLLTYIPYSASKEEQAVVKNLELFSTENNVKYLNMLGTGVVDYLSDFSDKDHVNLSGALKFQNI